jgi:hypothetical protein
MKQHKRAMQRSNVKEQCKKTTQNKGTTQKKDAKE